jgi:hypothetical protein
MPLLNKLDQCRITSRTLAAVMPGFVFQKGIKRWIGTMDWIELWFGFTPDNGDGSVELLIMVVVGIAVAIGILWRVPRARAATLRFVSIMHMGLRGNRRS